MIWRVLFPFLILSLLTPTVQAGTQTPSSLKIKLKQFWVSTSKQCTNPILVYTNPAPSVGVEITTAPSLGTGRILPGTYECVILVMTDTIQFTATATVGTCTNGQVYTRDLCRSGTGINVDGTVTTCGDGVEDTMTLYVSTASSAAGGNMAPPTTDGPNDPNGEFLTSPLVVTAGAGASGIFRFVTTNALSDAHANCSPEYVSFGFVN